MQLSFVKIVDPFWNFILVRDSLEQKLKLFKKILTSYRLVSV